MPRPRKDGRPPAPAIRVGRRRLTEAGKPWAVRAYGPTPENPHGRVTYVRPGKIKPTSKVPEEGERLDDLFDRIEGAFDRQVRVPGERVEGDGARDMEALGNLYLGWLVANGRSDGYVANRLCIVNKWITPNIGSVLVSDWSSDHSTAVLTAAARSVGAKRVDDIRSTLSGLRKAAHRKRPGGRWLDPQEDPLEDCTTLRETGTQGRSTRFVPHNRRPDDDLVTKAIAAADEIRPFDWMPRIIKVAAYQACRLGEQLALRAIDVDLRAGVIDVNGSWTVARKATTPGAPRRRWRKTTKNGLRRETPFPESQRADILVDCRRALGLPADAEESAVIAAIDAERTRRARRTGDWRDHVEPIEDECWLYPDESGVPPTKERFNDAWHKVRDASGWPNAIPYKNLRHYAIQRWKRLLDLDYENLAVWSGHDHRTLEAYYRIPSERALSEGIKALRKL